ncbi:VOC family protein [Rummeliibacillus sp. G93]|uniref:VOC family protein n=1 Tax=Rummeliibacillus sp. G93 TaxID=2939494 RepID=UPI00201BFC45|nr:VOC family protein [Rummeliibacillus sp. G93]UQW97245.1 VOC family protein [Rummeliibacillus sp. G93]
MGIQLNPYLMSTDAKGQANFYVEALGGEIITLKTYGETPGTPEAIKDKVMHLAVKVAGGNTLMMSDTLEQAPLNTTISLALTYDSEDDAKEVYAKLGEGGEFKHPFEKQVWGEYYGDLVDKYGVTWMVTAP